MNVKFVPALGPAASLNGAIIITDNAPVSQQVMDVKGPAVLPLTFSLASLTFAAQTMATTSSAQTITVTNNLTTSLTPSITTNGDFAIVPGGSTPCAETLATHATCTFTVTFTPSAVGVRTGAVTITDSANPGVQTINLTGTGQ